MAQVGGSGAPGLDWRPGAGLGALGAVLLAAAVLFDAEPLYVPGIVVVLLVVAGAAWVVAAGWGAHVTRELAARRVVEGAVLDVRVDVRGGPLGLAGSVVEEPLLHAEHRLPARREHAVRIAARFERRGRRELAASALVIQDPLGLFAWRRSDPAGGTHVLVLPRVEPVEVGRDAGGHGAAFGRHRSPAGTAEVEIDGLRPHRRGTPASRIHWPAYARGAGLLDRRLLPESDGRPAVVLDTRAPASPDALDAALRAVASLVVHLARRGGCAVLLPGDRRPVELDETLHGWARVHARLALAEAGASPAVGALGPRRVAVFLVCARAVDPPAALVAASAGQRVLVVPGVLPNRRAVFSVAGCRAYALARTRASGSRAA